VQHEFGIDEMQGAWIRYDAAVYRIAVVYMLGRYIKPTLLSLGLQQTKRPRSEDSFKNGIQPCRKVRGTLH
jgi:hypothetical protein